MDSVDASFSLPEASEQQLKSFLANAAFCAQVSLLCCKQTEPCATSSPSLISKTPGLEHGL